MVNNLARIIATKMVNKKIVENEDKECYIYGLELLISKVIVLSIIFIIAIGIKLIIPSIIFTFFYLLLRQYTGGFHCQTAERCICLSIVIYIIYAYICKCELNNHFIIIFIMSVVSYISILVFSPLADANKEIDDYEKDKYRKIAIILGSIMFVIEILSFILNYHYIFVSIAFSLLADAILLVIAILQRERRSKKKC